MNGELGDAEIEYSIVLESYNVAEGRTLDSLRAATEGARRAVMGECESRGEVILVTAIDQPEVRAAIPEGGVVRHCVAPVGASYDAMKNIGAEAARGEFVVFLD